MLGALVVSRRLCRPNLDFLYRQTDRHRQTDSQTQTDRQTDR